MIDTRLQIQEAQKIPSRINTKKSTPKHIIFKLQETKDKEKNLKEIMGLGGVRGNLTYRRIRVTEDFSSETMPVE